MLGLLAAQMMSLGLNLGCIETGTAPHQAQLIPVRAYAAAKDDRIIPGMADAVTHVIASRCTAECRVPTTANAWQTFCADVRRRFEQLA